MALFIAELVILFFFLLLGMKFWTKNKTNFAINSAKFSKITFQKVKSTVPENQEYVSRKSKSTFQKIKSTSPENQELRFQKIKV